MKTAIRIESLQIKSIHNTLAEAVEASGMDLSYNPSEAQRSIKLTEEGTTKAFVMEDGKVLYLYKCDITLLNEFHPFSACISDSPFQQVMIDERSKGITIIHCNWPKCQEIRKLAAKNDLILTSN